MGLIYFSITYILSNLSSRLTGIQINYNEYMNAVQNMDPTFFKDIIADYHPSSFAVVLDAVIRILLLILRAGFILFMLNIMHQKEASYYNLLDGFGLAGKVILLYLLVAVFVLLWALLFIIPGIIAMYKYRMALYLLLENPKRSPMECITESKRLMNGYKGQLFVLDLSFIGWLLLSAIPFVSVYVAPYMQLTYVGFYDYICAYNRPGSTQDNYSGSPDID